MTLKELLYGMENQKYRLTHTYNLPQKSFEEYLRTISFVDMKCKTYIQVLIGDESDSVDFSAPVENKGFWVAEKQGDWVLLFNFVLRRQAEEAIKDKDAFILTFETKRRMNRKDYAREIRKKSVIVKEEYLKSYAEDEGLIHLKDVQVVLNCVLRGNSERPKETFLYREQKQSYDRVVLTIEKLIGLDKFKELKKYIDNGGC